MPYRILLLSSLTRKDSLNLLFICLILVNLITILSGENNLSQSLLVIGISNIDHFLGTVYQKTLLIKIGTCLKVNDENKIHNQNCNIILLKFFYPDKTCTKPEFSYVLFYWFKNKIRNILNQWEKYGNETKSPLNRFRDLE